MRRLSKIRFREYKKIEDERAIVMSALSLLIHAHSHLGQEAPCPGNLLAMDQINTIAGETENINAGLYSRSKELWEAILELDGFELSSPDITREQERAEQGLDLLQRIRKHMVSEPPGEPLEDGLIRAAIGRTFAELENKLVNRRSELRIAQREFQLSQAEASLKPSR
ncbi:MAG TPA: hypothetical protein VIW23_04555 [Candidatus Acidoferrum sp.]